jgi:hypothetical protein
MKQSEYDKIYNFSKPDRFVKAFSFLNYLKEKGAIVSIIEVKERRSAAQNRSLHLFFRWCADALNDAGLFYVFSEVKGYELEMPWTDVLFKENFWRPIQLVMIGEISTAKLKRNEIDIVFDIICKYLADKGISISFPNQFDYFLSKN